jgi:hypothetical protein
MSLARMFVLSGDGANVRGATLAVFWPRSLCVYVYFCAGIRACECFKCRICQNVHHVYVCLHARMYISMYRMHQNRELEHKCSYWYTTLQVQAWLSYTNRITHTLVYVRACIHTYMHAWLSRFRSKHNEIDQVYFYFAAKKETT